MAREYMTPEERQAVERGDKWLREQLLGAAAPTRNRQMEDDQVYDENGELPPVSAQGGALSSVAPGTVIPGLGKVPTVAEYYGQIGQTGTDLDAFWAQVQQDRKAQYEAATEALKQRRFGPSKGEQLLALAAAIGRPTLDRSFGSIMANVTPALADIAATNRTAEQERFAAAQALRDKYLSDTQATQFNVLQQKQKNTTAFAPLIAAQLRANAPKQQTLKSVVIENGVGYDPLTAEKIVQPSDEAWRALAAAPTKENYDNFIRTFGPRFAEKAQRLIGYATGDQ